MFNVMNTIHVSAVNLQLSVFCTAHCGVPGQANHMSEDFQKSRI